jgi:hypothetical protein
MPDVMRRKTWRYIMRDKNSNIKHMGHCTDPLKHPSFEIVVVPLFVSGGEESLPLSMGA